MYAAVVVVKYNIRARKHTYSTHTLINEKCTSSFFIDNKKNSKNRFNLFTFLVFNM